MVDVSLFILMLQIYDNVIKPQNFSKGFFKKKRAAPLLGSGGSGKNPKI